MVNNYFLFSIHLDQKILIIKIELIIFYIRGGQIEAIARICTAILQK